MSFILEHPLYIPFIIFNIWLIYKVFHEIVFRDKDDDDSDDNDGGIIPDNPDLDLPPGVSLPTDTPEKVLTH